MASAIDTMTAEDNALMASMRDEGPEPAVSEPAHHEPASEPAHEPEAAEHAEPVAERQKTVPHEQFHAERERRKQVQAELAKFREEQAANNARLEERFRLLSQAVQPAAAPPAPAPVIPEFDADPRAHIDGRLKSIEQQARESQQAAERAAAAFHQQQQTAEVRNWAASQEQAFEAQTPDYRVAMGHLVQARQAQLEALGVADPAQRQQMLANEVAQIAIQTRQQGRNFAQTLYALAKASGYAVAPVAPSPVAEAIEAPATPAERQAATIERGKAMAATVGTVGTAPATKLSPERIASMNEREFAALYAKVSKDPAAMREMFGG